MMKLLVTGFEPFGGAETNPSWEAVRLIPDHLDGAEVHRLRLPVAYSRAGKLLIAQAARLRPDMVLCCGVAQGRQAVTPELVAVNWRMASIADNDGQRFAGEMIAPAQPAAYMTSWPVMKMVAEMEAAHLPARLSLSAGAYVCNDLYYHLLRHEQAYGYRGVFVHVPGNDVLQPSQAARALTLCVQAAMAGWTV